VCVDEERRWCQTDRSGFYVLSLVAKAACAVGSTFCLLSRRLHAEQLGKKWQSSSHRLSLVLAFIKVLRLQLMQVVAFSVI
jgi:hypothetical protein